MASFSAPALLNPIRADVPGIQALLAALAKMDPSAESDAPVGAKRFAETAQGWELQQFNGTTWVPLINLNVNAQQVDGYSATPGTNAGTIPVRDANGNLPGNILGNAATASEAAALSAVNPVAKGGTGANTAAQARQNLGVPPASHASADTAYGIGTASAYGHVKLSDVADNTLVAATGNAASPAALSALLTTMTNSLNQAVNTINARDNSQDQAISAAAAAAAARLPLAGGTMTGPIRLSSSNGLFGEASPGGGRCYLFDRSNTYGSLAGGFALDVVPNSNTVYRLAGYNDGSLRWRGTPLMTTAGGTLTGALVVPYLHVNPQDNTFEGGEICLEAPNTSYNPSYIDNYKGVTRIRGVNGAILSLDHSTGAITWNGLALLTSASTIAYASRATALDSTIHKGLPHTLPAGGTWMTIRMGWGSDWGTIAFGTAAGGTTMERLSIGSRHEMIAWRVA